MWQNCGSSSIVCEPTCNLQVMITEQERQVRALVPVRVLSRWKWRFYTVLWIPVTGPPVNWENTFENMKKCHGLPIPVRVICFPLNTWQNHNDNVISLRLLVTSPLYLTMSMTNDHSIVYPITSWASMLVLVMIYLHQPYRYHRTYSQIVVRRYLYLSMYCLFCDPNTTLTYLLLMFSIWKIRTDRTYVPV